MKKIKLNESIYITDPCYGTDTWCQALVKDIKSGNWEIDYSYEEFDNGECSVVLSLAHEEYSKTYCNYRYYEIESLGVDSGNLGVFDKEYYEKYHSGNKDIDNAWYEKNVMGQDFYKRYATTTDEKGVFCKTAYGDGIYSARIYIDDDNKAIGIEIEM